MARPMALCHDNATLNDARRFVSSCCVDSPAWWRHCGFSTTFRTTRRSELSGSDRYETEMWRRGSTCMRQVVRYSESVQYCTCTSMTSSRRLAEYFM